MRLRVIAAQRRLLFAMFFMAGGGYLFSPTIPSTFGLWVALGGSALIAGIAAALEYYSEMPNETKEDRQNTMFFVGLFHFALGWFAINLTIFGFVNLIFGSIGVQTTRVTQWQDDSRYSCEGPDVANIWFRRNAICMDHSLEKKYPPGSSITLRGRKTVLGINVDDVV